MDENTTPKRLIEDMEATRMEDYYEEELDSSWETQEEDDENDVTIAKKDKSLWNRITKKLGDLERNYAIEAAVLS